MEEQSCLPSSKAIDLHAPLGTAKSFSGYELAEHVQGLAQSGIEKWTVDTGRMTMTFYEKAGTWMLVEQII